MPRPAQRVGGLVIAGLGGFLAWLAFDTASRTGFFSLRASLLGPAFFVIGVGLFLFPGYREERLARGESLTGLTGLQLLTSRWWIVLVLSGVTAVLYTLALGLVRL